MTHELKILPKWFEDVKSGKKNFEIRRADRDFKVGDTLVLKEYEKGRYTGREIERTIQYIYKGDGSYGLSEEFWILGLKTNPTNGDMIKALFEVEEREITNYGTVRLKIGKTYVEHYLDWWNAPYKKGENNE